MKTKKLPYYQLIVINQNGQFHYSQNHQQYDKKESSDIIIGLASRFYALDNLQSTIVPEKAKQLYQTSDIQFMNKSKIQDIETSTFRMSVFQTVSGLRFMLITNPSIQAKQNQNSLQQIYRVFADYVLKDPSYSIDSLIQNAQFAAEVNKILEKV